MHKIACKAKSLIISVLASRWKKYLKKDVKKVQKNLEDKKKSVSLQPV